MNTNLVEHLECALRQQNRSRLQSFCEEVCGVCNVSQGKCVQKELLEPQLMVWCFFFSNLFLRRLQLKRFGSYSVRLSFDDVHYHHPSCFVSRIVQNIANIFTIYKCLFSQMIFVQYQQ